MSPSFPADSSARPLAYNNTELMMDGVPLSALAEEFGTPLYCYSAGSIAGRTQMVQQAFAGVEHTLCYAVKANSSLAILKMLGGLGCGFDIVSGGELERVWRAAPERLGSVVFSGVGKHAWEMDAALLANDGAGILQFNVESEAELEVLSARAQALGKTARIALRVNPDVAADTHAHISTGKSDNKFGIAIANARAVYRRAAEMPGIAVHGVSVHIGSQIRSVAPFVEAAQRVRTLVEHLREDGIAIRTVDAGGGLGVEYATAPFEPEQEVQAYARGVREVLAGMEAHLLLEPGRFLVAQAGLLLTRVLYRKENGGKQFVVTDAAMNDLIRPVLYEAHHEIWPVLRTGRQPAPMEVVGPVCESSDVFAHDRMLPDPLAGELLALLDAGAYGMTMSSHYNTRVRPAEVLVENGAARLIRRRETLNDLLAPEMV